MDEDSDEVESVLALRLPSDALKSEWRAAPGCGGAAGSAVGNGKSAYADMMDVVASECVLFVLELKVRCETVLVEMKEDDDREEKW